MLLEDKVNDNTKRIDELFDKFNPKDITYNSIFFENNLYDAYSVLLDIFDLSREEIIIIDNYSGKELLDMLRDIDKKIVLVSKNINDILKKKYKSQYSNVTFIKNDSFHDRFIIIDRKRLFQCGTSLKDIGKKCFGIHENKEKDYLNRIIETIGL
jgi:hypothetical protein